MDAKLITDLIRNRRATPPRFISSENLPKETIATLLENANWAPNHKKTEPWRFNVYTGKSKVFLSQQVARILNEKINAGAEIAPEKATKFTTTLERIPVVIAIIMQRDKGERLPEWEEYAAVSMAVQNMWLTATAMELGAFWATPAFMHFFYDLLDIQPGQKLLGFFYVGKIALGYPSPGRGDINDKVKWM